MLDARVYRAAFLPAIFALVIAAFSLTDRPAALTTTLEPDAFDRVSAYGTETRRAPRNSLLELARAFPDRRPGGAGDLGLADRMEQEFQRYGFATRRIGVSSDGPDGRVETPTIVAQRAGTSSRRLVVMAHRDAAAPGSKAELSGTAALLELARVTAGRDPDKTLVLVSTSGGSLGASGARAFAEDASDRIDAVIALGDLASERPRKPWVLPWSNAADQAPLVLRRTLEAAARRELTVDPGGARASAQWMHQAFPLAYGEAAELGREGVPAVLFSLSGDRPPSADAPVSGKVMERSGRAVLRALSALDEASARRAAPQALILTKRKVLPDWVVRLVVGTLLLPALVAAVDAFARARRRRHPVRAWLGWTALAALPFLLAYALARLIDVAGVVHAPAAPVPPGTIPFDLTAGLAVAAVCLAVPLAWFGLRRPLWGGLAPRGADPADGGAATAVGLILAATGVLVWAFNPYAAALLAPAIHGWMLAAAGEGPPRWRAALTFVVLGIVPVLLVAAYYAGALSLDPAQELWLGWLLFAGGHISPLAALVLATLLGCLTSVSAILRARGRIPELPPERPVQTRGPLSYAGPGSLGGTESALRR